ncbi:MAG: molybdopterin molybdenumtransferase MoeA, partial [Oscillospiraceae bacterium]|nr:molybdopterin molybdenumtransferase MoeA [Oscillospiraceae bacterium]
MLINTDYITARNLLLEKVTSAGIEHIPLSECGGRILAQDLIAAENIPPFDRSPYDGYAFMAADTENASADNPVTLRILGEIPAGAVPTSKVTVGTAVKILTGAPIPCGADAVVKFEDTEYTDETVTLFS